ncbi:MAG: hypothetical protein C4570_04630 [Ammonifex sp.]|nr:MAG: hypothetical protein C4570_04630 [Ammonifex sp.]
MGTAPCQHRQRRGQQRDFIADIRRNVPQPIIIVIADNTISKTKCPVCSKFMLLVKGKRGRMLVCQDRACGHRQPEKEDESGGFKRSRKARRREPEADRAVQRQGPHRPKPRRPAKGSVGGKGGRGGGGGRDNRQRPTAVSKIQTVRRF